MLKTIKNAFSEFVALKLEVRIKNDRIKWLQASLLPHLKLEPDTQLCIDEKILFLKSEYDYKFSRKVQKLETEIEQKKTKLSTLKSIEKQTGVAKKISNSCVESIVMKDKTGE